MSADPVSGTHEPHCNPRCVGDSHQLEPWPSDPLRHQVDPASAVPDQLVVQRVSDGHWRIFRGPERDLLGAVRGSKRVGYHWISAGDDQALASFDSLADALASLLAHAEQPEPQPLAAPRFGGMQYALGSVLVLWVVFGLGSVFR